MEVIKNINNNVSICIDGNGVELIAFGKGIGFRTPPYKIEDLSTISKIYYEIPPKYSEKIANIPEEILGAAQQHINSETKNIDSSDININELVDEVVKIIENRLCISINRSNFSFSRFYTHMSYFLERIQKGVELKSDNEKILNSLKKDYKMIYECTLEIGEYFKQELNHCLSEEEILYFILHINRLCAHEDCYRKGFTQHKSI